MLKNFLHVENTIFNTEVAKTRRLTENWVKSVNFFIVFRETRVRNNFKQKQFWESASNALIQFLLSGRRFPTALFQKKEIIERAAGAWLRDRSWKSKCALRSSSSRVVSTERRAEDVRCGILLSISGKNCRMGKGVNDLPVKSKSWDKLKSDHRPNQTLLPLSNSIPKVLASKFGMSGVTGGQMQPVS